MLDDSSYVITSSSFHEPLFDHAAILSNGLRADEAVGKAMWVFKEAGIRPAFFLLDDKRFGKTRSALESAGFAPSGSLDVMVASASHFERRSGVVMEEVGQDVGPWVDAYVASFYDDDAPLSDVRSAVQIAAKDRDVSLMLAKRGKEVVGELALFRRGRLLGAYCVGTIPRHRRSGVASAMLAHAQGLAEGQHLSLVLQTFSEDQLVGFYVGRGFERIYSKYVLLPARSI